MSETIKDIGLRIAAYEPLSAEEARQLFGAYVERDVEVKDLKRDLEVLSDRFMAAIKDLAVINTPEIHDFIVAVEREAKHQRLRWPGHDEGKKDTDWFWLLGWLAGKAVHTTEPTKQLHHIITTAAACLNWHSAKLGISNVMRAGIADPDGSGGEHAKTVSS
jgi:hypothetical protein